MTDHIDFLDEISNPLDSVEDILSGQDWSFNRMNDDELTVTVAARHGTYRMVFVWQEQFSAMQFSCQYNLSIPTEHRGLMANALMDVNADVWLGHFDLPTNGTPCFRHTSLFRGQTQTSGADFVGDLMEIAVAECERYYPLFQMMSDTGTMDHSLLKLAAQDTAGEA
ncbi:YbjN domain-containing protein [Micavibrio aeruginosavorus]|uniref:YbjN domain-containing protein n=1 Tax=Micavibrio aeruginosavorus TaxID=349221 RepID=UPI003F4AD093